MADNTTQNEFILSLVGSLDEATTKKNVQNALDKISSSVSLKSNSKAAKNAVTVFDKKELEKEGIAYVDAAKDINHQLYNLFKDMGTKFDVKKTFADDGTVKKFVATIYDGTKAIQKLNFEAAKFTDNTVGFRQVGGTSTTEKFVLRETELIKTENEQIDLQKELLGQLSAAKAKLNDGSIAPDSERYVKLNESLDILKNQIESFDFSKASNGLKNIFSGATEEILKTVDAEHKLYNEIADNKTGIFNIPALEKAGIQYYDTAVGIVQKVKSELEDKGFTPKIDNIIRNSEGQIVSFNAQIKNSSGVIDNLNYSMVQLTDGYKVFDGYMSSFGKQVDNSSQEYAKSLERQTKDLSKARTDLDDLMTKFLTGYGSKVLSGDDRANNILNKLVEAEDIINRLNSNAGMNTTAQMDGLKSFISGIKKEADEYVNLENVERKQSEQQKKDDEEKIKNTQAQISTLKKYKEDVNAILNDYVRVNGKNLITNDKYSTEIKDKAVGLLSQIYSMNQKAGLNTPEQMSNINDVIKGLKSEADEYYRINNAQKTLINNQTKEVDAIQKKVSAITGKYLDSSGNNQLLNTENIKAANEEIGKVYAKISELRANAGRKSYNFEANLSVLENMYNTLDKNVKGYYKLETEQKKSDELTQKQSKSIQQYLIDIQKIKNTALNANSGKALLNESNIKTVTTELSKAENILNAILKGHTNGKIIPTKTFDELDIRLSKVNAEVSRLKDEETVAMASDKTVQSQLNALNRVEQKVKDIRIAYEDSFVNKNSNVTFGLSLSDVNNELDKLKGKAGSITEEEMRNLNNLTNGLKRTASMLADNESQIQKTSSTLEHQANIINKLYAQLDVINRTTLNDNARSKLVDTENLESAKNQYNALISLTDLLNTKNKSGKILTDSEIQSANNLLTALQNNIKVYKDEESLQQSLTGTIESQKNALTSVEQKIFSIQSKLLDGTKITTPSYISDINTQVANIATEIERLMSKAGSVTQEESRNLSVMVSNLQRVGDEYSRIDAEKEKSIAAQEKINSSQLKEIEAIEKSATALNNKYLRSTGSNQLFDVGNIQDVRECLQEIGNKILYIRGNIGKSGFDYEFRKNDLLTYYNSLELIAKGYYDVEKAIANDNKTIESQKKIMFSIEEQAKTLSNNYISKGGKFEISSLVDQSKLLNLKITQEHKELGLFVRLNLAINEMNDKLKNGEIIEQQQILNLQKLYNETAREADAHYRLGKQLESEGVEYNKHVAIVREWNNALADIQRNVLNINSETGKATTGWLNTGNTDKVLEDYNYLSKMVDKANKSIKNGLRVDPSVFDAIQNGFDRINRNITVFSEQDGLERKISTARTLLDAYKAELQRTGMYAGELKTKVENLYASLGNIKTKEEFNVLSSDLEKLRNNIKQANSELKAAFQSEDVAQKLNLLSAQVTAFMNNNSRAAQLFKSDFEALKAGISNAQTQQDLVKLQNNFKLLQQQVNNAGKAGKTFGERIAAAAKKFLMWTGMTNVMMRLIRSVRQMITNVKELDTAMVLLRRVTNETDETYTRMFNNAIDKAKELKTSVSDLITSTAEFAKLGYSSEDSEVLAQAATVYKNVGQIDNIEDATKSITSTLAGFKMEASEVWDIVDKFDNIGNKFAISSSGIGDALMRSAASLSEANNTLDESIALATTANSVVKLCHLAIVI